MDKGWMSKNRLSQEYEDGVDYFLNYAIANGKDPNAMWCPCVKCGNLRENDAKTIRAHLIYNGVDLTYCRWIHHGEIITSHTNDKAEESTVDREFYSNEPVDMVHDAYVDNPTHLHKLLDEAEMPLYSGCSKFTKLSAIVKLYNLKAKYGWSDTSFTDLLVMIGQMLPEDNVMPASLYEARNSLSTLGIKYEKIHACPKDCILYRNEHANLVNCPTCGSSSPIGASSICVYIWHLYKECMNTNLIDIFRFINPHPISHNPKVDSAEKATIVGKRLIGSSMNQLVFVPCNVGFHWILMVVDPHKEKVYVLDSLSNNYHFDEWKSIMEMAMKMFNMSIGKRGRQGILWEVIKCQQQPDEKQCGFYVMRYMRDIIENRDSLPIPLLFSEGFYFKNGNR